MTHLWLVDNKHKVIADGQAGAIYLSSLENNHSIKVDVKLIKKDVEKDFKPRVLSK